MLLRTNDVNGTSRPSRMSAVTAAFGSKADIGPEFGELGMKDVDTALRTLRSASSERLCIVVLRTVKRHRPTCVASGRMRGVS